MPDLFKLPTKRNRIKAISNSNRRTPETLNATKLAKLVQHYKDTYQVQIIINGESEQAKIVRRNKLQLFDQDVIQAYINSFKRFPLTTYVIHQCCMQPGNRRFDMKDSAFQRQHKTFIRKSFEQAIPDTMAPYSDQSTLMAALGYYDHLTLPTFNSMDYLNDEELIAIEAALESNLNTAIKRSIKRTIKTTNSHDYLREQAGDAHETKHSPSDHHLRNIMQQYIDDDLNAFSQDDALAEIKAIQAGLTEGQYVGYIFTNQGHHTTHNEVVIISKRQVIKPLEWAAPKHTQFNSHTFATPYAYSADARMWPAQNTTPQASHRGCTTLGTLYLKELLRNSAKQLREYTLCFDFTDATGAVQHFFLPSPQVLKYSQSSFYNNVIQHMLESCEDTVTVYGSNHRWYDTPTIESMLTQSLTSRQLSPASKAINRVILQNLKPFRAKWMAAYRHHTLRKRALFQPGKNQPNIYLQYKSHKPSRILPQPARAATQDDEGSAAPKRPR